MEFNRQAYAFCTLIPARFEKELREKLSQKASGMQNEEAVLTRAMKFFDLDNDGMLPHYHVLRILLSIRWR